MQVLLVQKQMSERVTALARHDFPERPHQNAHLDCLVRVSFSHSHSILFLFITFSHAPFRGTPPPPPSPLQFFLLSCSTCSSTRMMKQLLTVTSPPRVLPVRWRLKACGAPSRTWGSSSPRQPWLTPPWPRARACGTPPPASTTPSP